MASIYRIYASISDANRDTFNASYAAIREATSTTVTTTTLERVGQSFTGSNYYAGQYFPVFDTSIVSTPSSGIFSFAVSSAPTIFNDVLELRAVSAVTNMIAGTALASQTPLFGSWTMAAGSGRKTITLDLSSGLPSSATCSMILHSQNQRLNVAAIGPTHNTERPSIHFADAAGTTNDPYLDLVSAAQWQFVGVSNVVEATATAHPLVTTGIAGALAAGDLLVACISSRIASTTSITLPTGGAWTLVSEQKNNNTLATTSAIPSGMMAYCIRGASNPNLTFTHPVAPNIAIGRIVAYRNVNQASPKDTQTSFTTATVITAVSGTGLTTTQEDDLLVAMACGGQEAAWSVFNATDPATASGATNIVTAPTPGTWIERADSLTTTGADTSLAIFDAVKVAAGATGNLTATASMSAAHVVVAGAFKIATGGAPAAKSRAARSRPFRSFRQGF